MTNENLMIHPGKSEIPDGTSIAKLEQDTVREIRRLLRHYELLKSEGRDRDGSRTEKQASSLLDQLVKWVDEKLKRYANNYIRGGIMDRKYMAPIITSEEIHAELRANFVQEIKLTNNSGLDWENYFFPSLIIMSRRVTRELIVKNGFTREASPRFKTAYLQNEANHEVESVSNDDVVKDVATNTAFHNIEIGTVSQDYLSSIKKALTFEADQGKSEKKRQIADRRVRVLEMMLTNTSRGAIKDALDVDATTIFTDVKEIRKVAAEVMANLGMVPRDFIAPYAPLDN